MGVGMKDDKPKNWHQRIREARRNDGFSSTDVSLASSGVDCACGEQSGRIPRDPNTKAPIDMELALLGNKFYGTVMTDDYDGALATLYDIEKRSSEILRMRHPSHDEVEVSQK